MQMQDLLKGSDQQQWNEMAKEYTGWVQEKVSEREAQFKKLLTQLKVVASKIYQKEFVTGETK